MHTVMRGGEDRLKKSNTFTIASVKEIRDVFKFLPPLRSEIMVKCVQAFGAVLLLLFLSTCSTYPASERSSEVVTVGKEYRDFTGVYLKGTGILRISQGDDFAFKAIAERRVLKSTDVTINGGVLTISYLQAFVSPKIPEYEITLPRLSYIAVKGNAKVIGEGPFDCDELRILMEGNSTSDFNITARRLELKIRGTSCSRIKGSVTTLCVASSGSTRVEALGLAAKNVRLDLEGRSKTEIAVQDLLDVDIRGRANVEYLGAPRITSTIDGEGRIKAVYNESAGSKTEAIGDQK